jgi:hypothetical protein
MDLEAPASRPGPEGSGCRLKIPIYSLKEGESGKENDNKYRPSLNYSWRFYSGMDL